MKKGGRQEGKDHLAMVILASGWRSLGVHLGDQPPEGALLKPLRPPPESVHLLLFFYSFTEAVVKPRVFLRSMQR